MELRVLKYFLMVAREENITKAARLLHITQPTLSRQLIQLEEELGVQLFHRGKYHVTLTNDGMLLKRRAQEIVALTEKTQQEFQNRDELKNLLTPKTYTQSIGFLRIPEGTNILDATSIHPESYDITLNLLKLLNLDLKNIGTEEFNKKLDIDIAEYAKKLNTDVYTLEDIIKSLQKPNRDPRDDMPKPLLKSDVLHLEDLKPGMKLQGTVRNVTPFGAFIDIGIKNDGLAHISKLTNKYIK